MTALVRGEIVKLRSTRTAACFAGAVLLLIVASVLLSVLTADVQSVADKRADLAFGGISFIVLLVFGAVGATSEYRHRTLAPTLLVAPDRARLVVARLTAYTGCALVIGVLLLIVTFVLGLPLLPSVGGPSLGGGDYLRVAAGGLLAGALGATLGAAVGTLVRNQVAAIAGLLVWLFIAEPLVGLASHDVRRYSLTEIVSVVSGSVGDHRPTFAAALVALLLWTAVFAAAAIAVDRRRDVT